MARRAVSIPEEWFSEEKRIWSDKEAYLSIFREILDKLDNFLTIEKTVRRTEFESGAFAKRLKRSKGGPWRFLHSWVRSGSVAGVLEQVQVPIFRTQPTPGNLLGQLRSSVIVADRWDNIEQNAPTRVLPVRYRLSVYELHRIVLAFKKAYPEYIEGLREEHSEGATTRDTVLRHAATELNKVLEPFAPGFKPPQKAIKFGKNTAISDFLDALYGKSFVPETLSPKRVHDWCRGLPPRSADGASSASLQSGEPNQT
jgi:hypothetical protein